jgi:acetoin utilization deacetylase AcuC-like enzyme
VLTVATDAHRRHHPAGEILDCGRPVAPPEIPERAERVLAAVREARLGDVVEPREHGRAPLLRVHAPGYVEFLEHVHDEWRAATGLGEASEAVAYARPIRGEPGGPVPHVIGRLGWYSHDSDPILAGTWVAASAAADVALTAADAVRGGAQAAYALCRPPGHHASVDSFAGYCYLNNAAIAAQSLCDAGARVAIVDVDFHHGNGTQQIFSDRADVLFVSLHADPADDYPYFSGFAHETGTGAGEGATRNYPLPPGTDWDRYAPALDSALGAVRDHGPDAVVVSLGVDTALEDADSFRLVGDDYVRMGAALATVGRPTLFVQEGGYCLEVLGRNVVSVLHAFSGT